MTYSAAEAVIKMADSLTAEVMMWAADYWWDALQDEERYTEYDSYEYEMVVHFPEINWNCRFVRWAIEEMHFANGSWIEAGRDELLNDEIPF